MAGLPVVLRLALVAAGLSCAVGLPNGAPAAACADLRPRHGSHLAQSSASPYRLETEPRPDGGLSVRLSGDTAYQGVLLRARSAGGEDTPPPGRFLPSNGLALLDCGGYSQSALTHTNTAKKPTPLEAVWQPSSPAAGDVEFVATVVKQYNVWWEGLSTGSGPAKPGGDLQLPASVEDVYQGCYKEHGCFGTPSGCVASRSCDVLLTYVSVDNGIRLGLMAATEPTYAAVGISSDGKMGSDETIFCANGEDVSPVLYYGYNTGHDAAFVSGQNPKGTSELQTWEEDGHYMCTFTQQLSLEVPGHGAVDLAQNHFLLIATGALEQDRPGYHYGKKIASAQPVNLTQYTAVTAAGMPALIRAHAICMTLAWIGLAGIGILSAQHLRLTWVGKQLWGKDIWFQVHRSLMVTTASLTWIGFVLIIVHLKKLSFAHNHNIVGFVVFLITILQVLAGLARPGVGARLRPVFNWAHRLSGLSGLVLALAALFLAQPLPQPGLPRAWLWILTAVVAVDAVVSLAFLAVILFGSRFATKILEAEAEKAEAPGSSLRKLLLLLYACCSLAFSVAMVAVIAEAQPGS